MDYESVREYKQPFLFSSAKNSGFGYLNHELRTPQTDVLLTKEAINTGISIWALEAIVDSKFGRYMMDDYGDNLDLLKMECRLNFRTYAKILEKELLS